LIQPQRLPKRALPRAQFDPATTENTAMSKYTAEPPRDSSDGYIVKQEGAP
jgi:hypothetical protein